MKKRTFAALLCAALLLTCAACGPAAGGSTPTPVPTAAPTPTASPTPVPTVPPAAGLPPTIYGTPVPVEVGFAFTRSNFPRLDGSATLSPLGQAVCSAILGENREEVTDLVRFNQTTTAYYNLLWGYADLLLAGEPGNDVLEEQESLNFRWEMEPFVLDALVIVVNEDNPVASVTVEELRRIYAGEITNWSELGGKDEPILPIQRGAGTESQAVAERLLAGETSLLKHWEGCVASEPEDLIDLVRGEPTGHAPAEGDEAPGLETEEPPAEEELPAGEGAEEEPAARSTGAIGYSIYYFAATLRETEGVRLLAVEGAEPTADNIREGKYPLVDPKYVVIPADAEEEAPNRVLFSWLLGPEGQWLVAHEGYVSVRRTEAPEEEQ